MSTEQALAFHPQQLSAMSQDVANAITDTLNSTLPPPPYPTPPSGNWSDYPYYDHYNWTDITDMPEPPHYTADVPYYPDSDVTSNSNPPEDFSQDPGATGNAVSWGSDITVQLPTDTNLSYDGIWSNNEHSTRFPGDWEPFTGVVYRDDDGSHNGDVGGSDDFNNDRFEIPSHIQDAIDAIPDSITLENVDQFLDVLAYIPAADMASKLVPSVVS